MSQSIPILPTETIPDNTEESDGMSNVDEKKWSVEDDKLLASSYHIISIDSVKGNAQNTNDFWTRIARYFNEHVKSGNQRKQGISAIASVLMQLCNSGGHVVAQSKLYGGTHALLNHFLPRTSNITTSFVDIEDLETVKSAMVEGKTNVLYLESISNPTLTVANIPELSRLAHDKGVKVVVDNTFAPMVLSPARLGADVVVQSLTKFISGGSDIIAGAVCGPASLVNSMMDLHQGALLLLGPTLNPKLAFEISQRIPHLGLRMKEHSNRAMVYATRIKKMGLKVIYPGLTDHPDHQLLKSIANKDYGFGGLLSLDMGTEARANRLMNQLQNVTRFGFMAVSLGYYGTLMTCSGSSVNSAMNEEERKLAGISPGLVRMSIGYMGSLEQKWDQFEKAISKMED
ncbi:Methionine gamma-lyase [Linum perenne]